MLSSNEHILRNELFHPKDIILFFIQMIVDGNQDRCISVSLNTAASETIALTPMSSVFTESHRQWRR
jgi:hypothetical protein